MKLRKKILLADDDIDDRMLFEAAYKDRSDIVILPCALSGVEVLERLDNASSQDLPDLIILDQNMPKLTGKQTLQKLKSIAKYAHIPICICSTYADHQLLIDCLKLGAYRVSSKPITDDEYQKMMNDFMGFFITKSDKK